MKTFYPSSKLTTAKKIFLLISCIVFLPAVFLAQKNAAISKEEFSSYNEKRLIQVEEQHRMLKTYFGSDSFEEFYAEAAKIANVSPKDNQGFHDMIKEKYFYKDKIEILTKINLNLLNDANVAAYIKSKIKEYASYYKGAFLQGKTSLLGDNVGSVKNVNPEEMGTFLSERLGTNVGLSVACGNVDFELGNFNQWFAAKYNISAALNCGLSTPNPMPNAGFNFTAVNVTSNEHGICSAGTDPTIPALSTVSPFGGGTYSCRLGDITDGCGAAQMSFSFTVSSSNINFTYDYAAVLFDGHVAADAPKIQVSMIDLTTGQPIGCAAYNIDATQAAQAGSGYLSSGIAGLYYKPWSQVFVPLTGYIGKNVQVNLLTTDCDGGAHRGYAYFDFHCSPFFFTLNPNAGCTGNSAQIIAPGGAATYNWTTLGSGTIISGANTQTITVNTSGDYQVTMTAFGSGCSYTIDTTITITAVPVPTASFSAVPVCAGSPMQFTDQSVTNGAPPFTSWSWNFGNGNTSTAQNPTNVYNTSGTFAVTFTANNGCPYTYSTTVTVNPSPTVTVTNATICSGATPVALTANGANTYTWNTGVTGSNLTVSPNATTSYTVTGSSALGCTVTATTSITVNPNPTVTVNNATICDGAGPVTLTAAGANTYTWSTGAIGNSISISPATTTNYTVAASTAAGCLGSATTSITVIPNPTVTAVGSLVCFGFPASLNANGAATYTWTGPNLVSNNGASVTANPPTTATYTVVGTTATCTASTVATVTVLPTPTVVVTNQGPFCPGDIVPTPTFTSNPNDPNTTFVWTNSNTSIGLNGTGVAIPPSFTCNVNSTLVNIQSVITVTPTLNGCVGPPASYTIVLKPTPFVNYTPSVEYCPNVNTAAINFTAIPGGGVPSFFWGYNPVPTSIGLATSGIGSVPSFSTINTGTTVVSGTIYVHAVLNGCTGPDSLFTITVNPSPKASFVYSSACIGKSTSLTDESTIGVGSITNWSWDLNNDGIFGDATNQNPTYTFAPAGSHNVGLTVTSNKGCKNIIYEPVYVNFLPAPNFAGDNLMGCPVHPVNFTESSVAVAPAHVISWSWDFGNGQTSVSQSPTTVLFYNSSPLLPINYTVSLTVKTDSGCVGTITKPNYITVYPQPIAGFNWDPADADILDPTIHFTNTSVGGSGNLPIKYYLGDVFIGQQDPRNWTNLTNPIHTYNDQTPDTYYVTQWVKNIYGCKDSITHPITINPAYTFYIPNAFSPNGDNRNDGFKGTGIGIDPTTYNIWVFDRWGNEIFHTTNMEETWNGRVNEVVVQEDTYVWKVRFSDISGAKHEYNGIVNLIK